ncbi:sugar transporter [Bifidobacterium eulemuris]|uniref:Sugar transporter n=2 Tax=Bifidobacterium eulemuris TaxID=1765219 RepID=A0A261G545_9BIFI|nr:sugar transporter [Bifidobacterium eulemuris]
MFPVERLRGRAMAGLFQAVSKHSNPLGNRVQPRGTGRYTFGLALSAGLAGLLYGYDTVSISGAIDFLQHRYHLSTMLQGLVISSIMIGGVFGAAMAGFLSDRFGRRRILLAGAAFFFVAALWSAFTFSPFDLIIARIVGGVGIGLATALAVTYITESAPTSIRGTLAFSFQLLAICGIFLTNVINYFIAENGSLFWNVEWGWRWMLGLGAVPAAVFFIAMLVVPESPRFLIQQGREDEGFQVLEHILGTTRAREQVEVIHESVVRERELNASFLDLFRPGLRKALGIGIFLAIGNQLVGMNAISYYGPTMFKHLGFGDNTEFLAASCVGGVELVFTVIGMYLIDAVGRKRLMAIGSALMAVFALLISYAYLIGDQTLTLVAVMLFTASFAFSMGPIPWIMIPELFPTFLRGRATGICTAFLLATNWAIGQFTPLMFERWGGRGTFFLFAICNLICLIGVITLVPETMDRMLEDIEYDWQPRTPMASARMALASAGAQIRWAEITLARVENERMQAMGVIEQAERERVRAHKQLFELENQAAEWANARETARLAEEERWHAERVAHTVNAAIVEPKLHHGTERSNDDSSTMEVDENVVDAATISIDVERLAEAEAALEILRKAKESSTSQESDEPEQSAEDRAREDRAIDTVLDFLDTLIVNKKQ